jgi:hypothetical protein
MPNLYSFQVQNSVAKPYEDKIIQFFQKFYNCIALTDLRDSEKYRDYDIDFHAIILQDEILKSRMYEIKVDTKISRTRNFYIEPDGWLRKCKAEIILYLDANKYLLYYLNNYELKRFVYNNVDKFRSVTVDTSDWGSYSVNGILLPYDVVIKEFNPLVEDLTEYLNEIKKIPGSIN